ncbi:unnamed protein product [Timema podura]|uniref:Uncharacterized protein n=1 Tax=Timema podura TaxID=61482 RepID=A0ABN7PC15_TIMPD|nr:unnamed protein product [Timema podura]
MEGFMEFTRTDWLERIVSWQRPQGCYGDTEADGKELGRALSLDRRVKRDDGAMEFNCTMHVTGLAAAALAVGVKSLVEVSLQIQS